MVLIVGAGAAGLAAAVFAASTGSRVVVIEKTADGGRKILISGGGRCNVLPAALEPHRFVSESAPQLVQRFLRSWPLRGQIEFFEREVGVPLVFDEETRKWFPRSNRARDVRDGLLALARARGTELRFGTELRGLAPHDRGWRVETNAGPLAPTAVVLATGGLSVPATGSTGTGLDLARALGHRVNDTYPALTPIVSRPARHAALAGVSLPVAVVGRSARGIVRASGGFLFTHRGYSGPAVLDVSHVVTRGDDGEIRVRWAARSEQAWHAELGSSQGLVTTVLGRHLPQRLASALVGEAGLEPGARTAALRRDVRTRLVGLLTQYVLPWSGDGGYAKAEVTGGGVALEEVDPKTLESRRCPRLFLCGELLDAFGPIGGHNFAWAWATGRLAGRGAALCP